MSEKISLLDTAVTSVSRLSALAYAPVLLQREAKRSTTSCKQDISHLTVRIRERANRLGVHMLTLYICGLEYLIHCYSHSGNAVKIALHYQEARRTFAFTDSTCVIDEILLDINTQILHGKNEISTGGELSREYAGLFYHKGCHDDTYWLSCHIDETYTSFAFLFAAWAMECDEFLLKSLAEHYEHILAELLFAPAGAHLSDISLLTAYDDGCLRRFNDTKRTWVDNFSIPSEIDRFASMFPDKPAIIFKNELLCYWQISEDSTVMAERLTQYGVKTCDIVCVCMEPSADAVTLLTALLRTGALFLPVDPLYPPKRIEQIIGNIQANYLCLDKEKVSFLDAFHVPTVHLFDAFFKVVQSEEITPHKGIAYIMYTSGSTGKPKGIPILRKSFENTLLSFQEFLPFSSNDVMLSVTNFTFDISMLEVFLPLISGGTCILAQSDVLRGVRNILSLLDRHPVTFLQATPVLWKELLRSGLGVHPSLTALCGGEVMDSGLAAGLLSRCRTVWNVYGPTETTIWSTAYKVSFSDQICIGSPIANTRIYITDSHRRSLPVGVFGELCIAGDGLAPGYVDADDQATPRFISGLPFINDQIYQTGDIARWLPTGELEFLSKTNYFAKYHSQRISLEEIERSLRTHPSIWDAAVIVGQDEDGSDFLAAFVVPSDQACYDQSSLAAWLSKALPSYMVPNRYLYVDVMPVTHNNKLDRITLAAMAADMKQDKNEEVAVNGEAMRLVVEALQSSGLQIQPGNGAIMEQWLDSLAIINTLGYLEDMGIALNYADVYHCRTIGELMDKAAGAVKTERCAPALLQPLPVGRALAAALIRTGKKWGKEIKALNGFEMTQTQRDMLLHSLLYRDKAFHCTNYVLVEGEFNIGFAREAYEKTIEYIDRFRTIYFCHLDGRAIQVVLDKSNCTFEYINGMATDGFTIDAAISKIRNRRMETSYSVPLLCILIQTGLWAYYLVFHFHHIVMDGISYDIFLKRYFAIYARIHNGDDICNEKRDDAFARYMLSQRYEGHREARQYWSEAVTRQRKAHAAGRVMRKRPYAEAVKRSFAGETIIFAIKTANRHKVSVNTVLLALLTEAFMKAFEILSFGYELVIAGRPQGCQDAVGMFIHTIPMQANAGQCFEERILNIHKRIATANGTGVEPVETPETMDFSVLIVFENTEPIEEINGFLSRSGCRIRKWRCMETTEKDINIYVKRSESLDIRVTYDKELFTRKKAERILRTFCLYLKENCNETAQGERSVQE